MVSFSNNFGSSSPADYSEFLDTYCHPDSEPFSSPEFSDFSLEGDCFISPDRSPFSSPKLSRSAHALDLHSLAVTSTKATIGKNVGHTLTISRRASYGNDPYGEITKLVHKLQVLTEPFNDMLEKTGKESPSSLARMHRCFEFWVKEDLDDSQIQCLQKVANHRQATKVLLMSADQKQLDSYFDLMALALSRDAWFKLLDFVKNECLPQMDNQQLLKQIEISEKLGLNYITNLEILKRAEEVEEMRRLQEENRRLELELAASKNEAWLGNSDSIKNWSLDDIPEDDSDLARTKLLDEGYIDALLTRGTSLNNMHYFSVMSKCLKQELWSDHLQLIWNKAFDSIGSDEESALAKVLAGLVMSCDNSDFPETCVARHRSLLKQFVALGDREELYRSVPVLHGPWWDRLQVLTEEVGSSEGSSAQEERPLPRLGF